MDYIKGAPGDSLEQMQQFKLHNFGNTQKKSKSVTLFLISNDGVTLGIRWFWNSIFKC